MGYKLIKSPNNLSGFYLVYKGSTLNERKGIYGISHLMEHLICKNVDHLRDDYDKDGVNFNAYTSSTEIVFYITGLNRYVNKWKKNLYENISEFKITDKDLQKEKKIVIEEYLDHFNEQKQSHMGNLDRKLFNDYGPIGEKNDINNITLEDCKSFFEKQFKSPTMIIDISSNPKIDLVNYFENLVYNVNTYDEVKKLSMYDYPHEVGNTYKEKVSIVNLTEPITDNIGANLLTPYLLSSGLNSPLYDEIREKRGLVYYVHFYLSQQTDNSGIVVFSTETNKKNRDELQNIFIDVLSNPQKYLTRNRFNLIKKKLSIIYKKRKLSLYKNIDEHISPHFSMVNYIKDITYDDIMDNYNLYYNPELFYYSTDDKEFE